MCVRVCRLQFSTHTHTSTHTEEAEMKRTGSVFSRGEGKDRIWWARFIYVEKAEPQKGRRACWVRGGPKLIRADRPHLRSPVGFSLVLVGTSWSEKRARPKPRPHLIRYRAAAMSHAQSRPPGSGYRPRMRNTSQAQRPAREPFASFTFARYLNRLPCASVRFDSL